MNHVPLLGLLGAGALLVLVAAAGPERSPAAPIAALRILSDRTLPPALEKAVDVRWASDRTVYLPLVWDGTVEASLDVDGPAPREMIPGARAVGGWNRNLKVGASTSYLVVGGPFDLTWRTLDQPLRREERLDRVADLDVAGSRLLVFGIRKDEQGNIAPDGTIAWLGSLDKELSDLRPVLADARGPGAPNFCACGHFDVSAARFLAGGSFMLVPGVQPGAYLYDSSARLVRTWDTAVLGLDSDCASLGQDQVRRLAVDGDARAAWLNQRRTLDEILPLPQGAGLVIRSVVDERTRWQLKVLRPSGSVETFDIPVASESARSHLRGDVRGGRIAFVLFTQQARMTSPHRPASRLILAEAPGR